MNSLEKLIVRDVRGGEVAPQLRRVAPPAPPAPLNVAASPRAPPHHAGDPYIINRPLGRSSKY